MRGAWLYAAGAVALVVAVAVGGFFLLFDSGDGDSKSADRAGCLPTASTQSAGNALISARALGKGFGKTIVISVEDKKTGTPLHEASVKIRAEMTCPHLMPLYEKSLAEASTGTYRGAYNLIMPGEWTFYITVRSKEGDATTSALPVRIRAGS